MDGWSSVGQVLALAALSLAVFAFATIAWPSWKPGVPLASVALMLGYLTIGGVVSAHQFIRRDMTLRVFNGGTEVGVHVGYGAYVGLAAAAIVLIIVGLRLRSDLLLPFQLGDWIVPGLCLALLVVLLLPWQRTREPRNVQFSEIGLSTPSALVAALLAVWLGVRWWRHQDGAEIERAAVGLAMLLLVGAAVAPAYGIKNLYGAWVGLAIAGVLTALTLREVPVATLGRFLNRPRLLTIGLSALLLTSLFLPWQTVCFPRTADLSEAGLGGRCLSSNAFGLGGSGLAGLTIALVVALTSGRGPLAAWELASAIALFVATLGFELQHGSQAGVRFAFGYGAIIGFCAAAALVIVVVGSRRPSVQVLRGATLRLIAVLLSIAFVIAVVVPWWGVLPSAFWSVFVPRLARLTWLSLASALLGVHLIHAWARRSDNADSNELGLLSLALVALGVLETLPLPSVRLSWNSAVLVGLPLLLTALALATQSGGFRSVRVPEVFRIDRIAP